MSEASWEVLSGGAADYLPRGARAVKGQLWLMREWLVFQPAPSEAAMGMQNVSLALNTVDFVGRGEFDVGRVLQSGIKTPIRIVATGQDFQFAVDDVDTWVAQVAAQVRAVKGEPQPAQYQPAAPVPPPPAPQVPGPPVVPHEAPPAPPPEAARPAAPPEPTEDRVPPPSVPQAPVPAPEVPGPPAPPVPSAPPAPPAPQEEPAPTPEAAPSEAAAEVPEAEAAPAPGEVEAAVPAEAQEGAVLEEVGIEVEAEKKPRFVIAPPPSEPLIPEAPPIPDDLRPAVEEVEAVLEAPAAEGEAVLEAPAAEGEVAPEAPGPEVEAAPEAPAEFEIVGIDHAYYEVGDVLSASSFYEDILGLAVEGEKTGQVAWLKAGDSRFALRRSGGGTQRGAVLAFEVKDVRRAREALRERGGFPEEILSGPGGELYFCVYDKDRNRIAIWERPKG